MLFLTLILASVILSSVILSSAILASVKIESYFFYARLVERCRTRLAKLPWMKGMNCDDSKYVSNIAKAGETICSPA